MSLSAKDVKMVCIVECRLVLNLLVIVMLDSTVQFKFQVVSVFLNQLHTLVQRVAIVLRTLLFQLNVLQVLTIQVYKWHQTLTVYLVQRDICVIAMVYQIQVKWKYVHQVIIALLV